MKLDMESTDPPFKVQVSLNPKYKPVIVRGRLIHEQTPRSTFAEKRKRGDTNLDLWLDSSIYPLDPSTGKRPKFNDVRTLLEYVGDRDNGLLGYTRNLENSETVGRVIVDRCRSEFEIESLRQCLDEKQREFDSLQLQMVEQQSHTERRHAAECLALRNEIQTLQFEFSALQSTSTTLVASLSADLEESMQSEVDLESQIDAIQKEYTEKNAMLVQSHEMEVQKLTEDLKHATKCATVLEKKCSRLQSTPVPRARKNLSDLSHLGGHAKKQRRLVRSILAGATMKRIQEGNSANRTKQRLCGSEDSQMQSGKVLARILSKKEVSVMLKAPCMRSVTTSIANDCLERIGSKLTAAEIVETMDRSGITDRGYTTIFKQFQNGVKAAGSGLRIGCLPKPYHVALLRRDMNAKLRDFVGDCYSINNSLEIMPGSRSKKKDPIRLKLSEKNSLFVDVEVVQRTMVQLYGFTPTELAGKPLMFVLKLDEAEIVHGQKLERLSITIMNRALDSEMNEDNPQYFAVQSEREIWPIGCFQVEKESHEVLSWVLNQTKIPTLISAQGAGQLLMVPGVGEFFVEWHLSADMKTIKCMYGLGHGACAKYRCIYCSQERVKTVIGTPIEALASFTKRGGNTWKGGLFSSAVQSKPVSTGAESSRWKPIIDIPLERVHMCTLHAFNRIIEKIVHLHFQFIWTIRDKDLKNQATEEMQKVVSSTGAHGGNVLIFKNEQLSGKNNSVPSKPSFNGVHAAKFFRQSILPQGSDKLYKDVVSAERNFINSGLSKKEKLTIWQGLDDLWKYFTSLKLSDELRQNFKTTVEKWGRDYISAFGETHVTHYIHLLVKHAPWFVARYGSLSIWSCQGMEYSHYTAKAAYQRHTQHGGGRSKKSPLVQTYQHWYRIIQHRFREKNKMTTETILQDDGGLTVEARIQKRREACIASCANEHSLLWRQKCDRVGSRWVPRTSELVNDSSTSNTPSEN